MGSQSPRGSYLVPLYKARGGPHVCPLFAFRNQPIATPRAASELHSRDDPDFKGMPTTNILRTGLHAGIKYIPVGWPRSGFAQGLHWQTNGLRDGPDFRRIPTMDRICGRLGPAGTNWSLYMKPAVGHMCACYSRFGTSQSQRRSRPRNYIREMANILRALHG